MKRCTYPYCGADRSECPMCNSSLSEAVGPIVLAAAFLFALSVGALVASLVSL